MWTGPRDPKQPKLSFYIDIDTRSEEESDNFDDSEVGSRSFLKRWLKKFLWAEYDKETDTASCSLCAKAGKSNDYATGGKSCPPCGWRKEYLSRHSKLVDHKNAKMEPAEAVQAQQFYDKAMSAAGEQTITLMRNVYFLARECIAVLKAKSLHTHVELLGCDVPTSHRGRYSSWEFVTAISNLLEQDILKELVASPYFSLIVDESNDVEFDYICKILKE